MSSKFDAVVLAGAAFIALGTARFAYSLVLPSMRTDLGLSFTTAGSLGTANTAGYLVGILTLPLVTRRLATVQAFRICTISTAVALVLTGVTHNYPIILSARFAAGYGGAGAIILGSAIAAALEVRGSDAVVIFNAGGGAGIIVAGLVLPSLLDGHAHRWPTAWFVLGTISIAIAVIVGRREWTAPNAAPTTAKRIQALPPQLRWLAASYACFGAGYIVFVTFLISTIRKVDSPVIVTSAAFALLGLAVLLAPKLWRPAIAQWTPRAQMAVSMLIQAGAAALLWSNRSTPSIMVSVILFGSSFLITPAIIPITVRRSCPDSEWATTIGTLTIFMALAQAVSPWLSGALIDRFGISAGPLWTLAFAALGATIAVLFGD